MMPYNPPRYVGFIEAAGFTQGRRTCSRGSSILPARACPSACVSFGERLRRATPHDPLREHVSVQARNRAIRRASIAARGATTGDSSIRRRKRCTSWPELRYIVDTDLVIAAEVDGRMVGCAHRAAGPESDIQRNRRSTSSRWGFSGSWRAGALSRRSACCSSVLFPNGEDRARGLAHRRADNADRPSIPAGGAFVGARGQRMTNKAIAVMGGRPYKTYRVYEKDIAEEPGRRVVVTGAPASLGGTLRTSPRRRLAGTAFVGLTRPNQIGRAARRRTRVEHRWMRGTHARRAQASRRSFMWRASPRPSATSLPD